MKKITYVIIAVIGIALAHRLGAFGLLSNLKPSTPEPTVAATIFPIADIAKHIAKDAIEVTQLVPSGASPHTFEPNPTDVAKVASAKVIYAVGHNLDFWASAIGVANNVEVVTTDKNITLREGSHEDEHEEENATADEHEGEEPTFDPHYWLTIPNAKIIATTIATDLGTRFPEKSSIFQKNLSSYLRELDDAEKNLRAEISGITNRNLVTFHDAWGYFAENYNFTIIATAEPTPGIEPTPRYLSMLRQAIIEAGVKTIYSEPTLSVDPITAFAEDEGLTIASLDPEGSSGAKSYIEMMLSNAKIIRENQK